MSVAVTEEEDDEKSLEEIINDYSEDSADSR